MIDELPRGWTTATLRDIADINPRHPRDLDDDLVVSFAPMPALNESRPDFRELHERPLSEVRKGFTHFAEGDVLFAKITPCMENGKAAVASRLRNGLGCGTTELHVLRPRDEMNSYYIYYFVHQPSFRRAAEANFTGTAGQARVPVGFMEQAKIPIAPSAEQRRIVAKMEALLDKVDASHQRLAKIHVLLKRFRQSVLAAACSGRLTAHWREENSDPRSDVENDSPIGWQNAAVGDVIESLKYGTAQKCSYQKRGAPVLRIPNIADGTISHSDLKYAELPEKEFQQLRLRLGDILLIRSNGSVSLVGKCALTRKADRDFAYAGYLIRLRPDVGKVLPEFLNLVLGTYNVRRQIEIPARSTSGVNNINSEEVRALQFLLPPPPEQQEIVRRVESLFALADQIAARFDKARDQVEKLTPSLLARAFRGKLVPQDPNDEPASALLERIRSNRNGLIEAPRKRLRKAVSRRE